MNLSLLQLNPPTRYAICGMAYMARLPMNRFALVQEVADAERMPPHFLAKIFQQLAQKGYLKSRRGPGGGYALAQAPEQITLLDILSAIEEAPVSGFCFLENRPCDPQKPCVMHEVAVEAGEALLKALRRITLAEVHHA